MQELRSLVDAYAVAVDDGDVETFRALFAHDAVLSVVAADGAEHHYDGADAIAEVPTKLGRYERTLHLVSTHRVVGDGDTATGVAYCEAHHVEAGGHDRVLFIRYDDEYVRGTAGWRFASRTVRTLREEHR